MARSCKSAAYPTCWLSSHNIGKGGRGKGSPRALGSFPPSPKSPCSLHQLPAPPSTPRSLPCHPKTSGGGSSSRARGNFPLPACSQAPCSLCHSHAPGPAPTTHHNCLAFLALSNPTLLTPSPSKNSSPVTGDPWGCFYQGCMKQDNPV